MFCFSERGGTYPLFLSDAERADVAACYSPFQTLFDSKLDTEKARRIFCAARDGLMIESVPQSISRQLTFNLWGEYLLPGMSPYEMDCTPFNFHNMSKEEIKRNISIDVKNMSLRLEDGHLAMEFLNTTTCLMSGRLNEAALLLANVYKGWISGLVDIVNNTKGTSVFQDDFK